jgi:hypothetical protein
LSKFHNWGMGFRQDVDLQVGKSIPCIGFTSLITEFEVSAWSVSRIASSVAIASEI